MRGISHKLALKHREALKVFLEFLKPFSSEKGFKPPEALERSDLSRRSRANAFKSAKGGAGGKQEFSPRQFRWLNANEIARTPRKASHKHKTRHIEAIFRVRCPKNRPRLLETTFQAIAHFRRFDAAENAEASQKPVSADGTGAGFTRNRVLFAKVSMRSRAGSTKPPENFPERDTDYLSHYILPQIKKFVKNLFTNRKKNSIIEIYCAKNARKN